MLSVLLIAEDVHLKRYSTRDEDSDSFNQETIGSDQNHTVLSIKHLVERLHRMINIGRRTESKLTYLC